MNKKILAISVAILLLITSVLLIACAKISDDPKEQAKALEDKGCTVSVLDSEEALKEQTEYLESNGIIVFNDIQAVLVITKDSDTGYIYYMGSISDAERLMDGLSFLGDYESNMQSTNIVYFGSKAIYDLMK